MRFSVCAAVGFGKYSSPRYDLGVQEDLVIPESVELLDGTISAGLTNQTSASVTVPADHDLRIIVRQSENGLPVRTSRGAPPNGTTLGKVLQIHAEQNGRSLPVLINYDKAVWSSLSWAVGEVIAREIQSGHPVRIQCSTSETRPVQLRLELQAVRYR